MPLLPYVRGTHGETAAFNELFRTITYTRTTHYYSHAAPKCRVPYAACLDSRNARDSGNETRDSPHLHLALSHVNYTT